MSNVKIVKDNVNINSDQELSELKQIYEVNIEEGLQIIQAIENNNSIIHKDNLIYTLNNYPFEEKNKILEFNAMIRDLMENSAIKIYEHDFHSALISIMSFKSSKDNDIKPLIALKIEKNIIINNETFINYSLLKDVHFNELQMNKLKEEKNFEKLLDILFLGLIEGLDKVEERDANKKSFSGISIEKKIEKIKTIFNYIHRSYLVENNYYIYYSIDINATKYMKKDYLKLKQTKVTDNPQMLFYYQSKIFSSPLSFSTSDMFEKQQKSVKLDEVQELNFIKNSQKNFSVTMGMAGTGKTFTSIYSVYLYLYYIAFFKYHKVNFKVLFTTYNLPTLTQFKEKFKEFGLGDILLVNNAFDGDCLTSLQEKKEIIKNKGLYIDKLLTVKDKLSGDFEADHKFFEEYNKLIDIENKLKKITEIDFNSSITHLYKYIRKFLLSKEDFNIIDKILYKLKRNRDTITIPNALFEKLRRFFGIEKDTFNLYEAEELLNARQNLIVKANKYTQQIKDSIKKFLMIYEETLNEMLSKSVEKMHLEDIIYYIKYSFLLNHTSQDLVKIDSMLSFLNGYLNNVPYSLNQNTRVYEENEDLIYELYPINLSIVSKVSSLYSINTKFDVVMIDEAFQVPGYMLLPVVYRSKKMQLTGDIKQIQSESFFSDKGGQNYFKIYEKAFEDMGTSRAQEIFNNFGLSANGNNALNLFLKKDSIEKNFMINNFRSNSDIVNATLLLADYSKESYYSFIKSNIGNFSKEKREFYQNILNNWNSNSMYEITSIMNHNLNEVETLSGEKISSSLFYYDDEKYEEIFDFLKLNNIVNADNLLFVTPFKMDALRLSDDLKKYHDKYPFLKNVQTDAIENIQGLERKCVIIFSNIKNSNSQSMIFLETNKEYLTTAISRGINMVIFVGNVSYIKESSSLNIKKLFDEEKMFKFYPIK